MMQSEENGDGETKRKGLVYGVEFEDAYSVNLPAPTEYRQKQSIADRVRAREAIVEGRCNHFISKLEEYQQEHAIRRNTNNNNERSKT